MFFLTFLQLSALPFLIFVLFVCVALLAANWTIRRFPIPIASVLRWEVPTTLPPDLTAYALPVNYIHQPETGLLQNCSTSLIIYFSFLL